MSFSASFAALATATQILSAPDMAVPPSQTASGPIAPLTVPTAATNNSHAVQMASYALSKWRMESPGNLAPLNDFDRGELRVVFDRAQKYMEQDPNRRTCSVFSLAYRDNLNIHHPADATYMTGSMSVSPNGELRTHFVAGQHGLSPDLPQDRAKTYEDLFDAMVERRWRAVAEIDPADPKFCPPFVMPVPPQGR